MAFQTRAIMELFLEDPSIPSSSAMGYLITDHNRKELQISYERIEKSDRMADGTMRRFITANKKKISTSWDMLPALSGKAYTADGNLGGAFLKSFYEENVYQPVWLKLTYAEEAWRNISGTAGDYGQNSTFKKSHLIDSITPSAYSIQTASIGPISSIVIDNVTNYITTASITTNVRTGYKTDGGDLIYISGIDSIFNGTFQTTKATHYPAYSQIEYQIKNPKVPINSFSQTSTTGKFNVDSTYWTKPELGGDVTKFFVKNALMSSGSVINSDDVWTWTGTEGNLITATVNTGQTATGRSAMAYIKETTKNRSTTISPFYAAVVGPAVSSDIVKCFITNFDYTIAKRLTYTDYVNISMEFTEI